MKYIHYGHKKFDASQFKEVRNRDGFTRPSGGFWASPVNSQWGWKEWCEAEEFGECSADNSFEFELRENAKVIHLYGKEDVLKLPEFESNFIRATRHFDPTYYIDFEELVRQGVDAIELHFSEDEESECGGGLYRLLNGWNCDSILVLNPNAVIVEDEK